MRAIRMEATNPFGVTRREVYRRGTECIVTDCIDICPAWGVICQNHERRITPYTVYALRNTWWDYVNDPLSRTLLAAYESAVDAARAELLAIGSGGGPLLSVRERVRRAAQWRAQLEAVSG